MPKPNEEEKEIKNIILELEISKEMAFRVYDEFDNDQIIKKEDGNFIVKVEFPENEWVYSFILSFGEYVEVISPEYAKNIVKHKLQNALKNYL